MIINMKYVRSTDIGKNMLIPISNLLPHKTSHA